MRRFKYTNALGREYYVHRVQCVDGRARYVMRVSAEGALAKLPPTHEVRENVHGRVTVRRERLPKITPLEQRLLRTALEGKRPLAYRLDVDGRAATVYASADDRKCFLESLDAEFAEGFADALSKMLSQRYPQELVQMFRDRQKDRGHLDDGEAYRRDRRKDLLLQENGYLVLRFLAEDVGKRLDAVLDAILRALAHRQQA
jgi:hypothetical protein